MLIDDYTVEELTKRCDRYEQLTKEMVVYKDFTNSKEYLELEQWFRSVRREIQQDEYHKTICIMYLLVGVFWFALFLAMYLRG